MSTKLKRSDKNVVCDMSLSLEVTLKTENEFRFKIFGQINL